MTQDWTVDARARTADIEVVVMTHGATGPVRRTHCMTEHTISLFLTPDYGDPQGRYCGGGESMRFARFGPLSIIPANIPLSVRSPGAPARKLISCRFDPARFQRSTGMGAAWGDGVLAACLDVRGGRIKSGLQRLARETEAPGFASDLLIQGLGMAMMAEIARYLRNSPGELRLGSGGLSPWQMRRIADAVASRPDTPPSLAELAALCGISSRHLMRAFKQTTGQTIMRFVEQARSARAMRLLSKTDLTMGDIARQLGFAAPSGFSHAFRRATGESPSSFRLRESDRFVPKRHDPAGV